MISFAERPAIDLRNWVRMPDFCIKSSFGKAKKDLRQSALPNKMESMKPMTTPTIHRGSMNGKPVFAVPAKTVLNMKSGFAHKLLCDGPTFSTGSACTYSCAFCYVPEMMQKLRPLLERAGVPAAARHEDIVIRRESAIDTLRRQLTDRHGRPLYRDPSDRRVIYSSPLVDVAGNMELVRETADACKVILDLTHWDIRLLSKSHLLPKVADLIPAQHAQRMIYGVSTGTLDDRVAAAFEQGAALVSKRLASLHQLQDRGLRTFGMICPSLPLGDYAAFAAETKAAIRADRCEHVWAEVINVRGESFRRTHAALAVAGLTGHAAWLREAFAGKDAWESYARATFEAHVAAGYRPGQLRFLQYVTAASREWWAVREKYGVILL